MNFIIDLITGPLGAICMVLLGLATLGYFIAIIPYKIATDSKKILDIKILNFIFAATSIILPFLAFIYLFINKNAVKKPLLIGTLCLIGTLGTFLARSFISIFFVS